MARRPPATLADYVLVGINPGLIMFLIGSLVFFLLQVFYRGDYDMRVSFVFAMFIMGAVAVCRISMEEGAGYAASFGGPLGLVAFIAINRFGEFQGALAALSPAINGGIIALVWWLAYQLTWDCTVLDERADTSDQGLLEAAGLDPEVSDEGNAEDSLDPALELPDDELREEPPAWMKWFERSKKPHAHGVWVIYFSLVALPLFGLGQWFVPQESRTYSFGLLVLYVATALALLMSTSFLGLRRYLRKRRLEMPMEMTANWLTIGSLMIVAVLALCILLPRPGAELAVSQIPLPTFGTQNLTPSQYNTGSDGQKQAAAARASSDKSTQSPGGNSGQTPGSGDQKGSQGQGSQQSNSGQGSEQQNSSNQGNSPTSQQNNSGQQPLNHPQYANNNTANGNQTASQNQSQNPQQQSSASSQNQAQNTTTPQPAQSQPQQSSSPRPTFSPTQLLPSIGNAFKLLIYLAVAALLASLAWKYRKELAAAWQQLLKEWREFLERWFGKKETEQTAADAAALPAAPRPFAAYADPFATGQAGRVGGIELLRYTFEALQAWGRENGCPRDPSETPHEYTQRLAAHAPHLSQEAATLAENYGRAAYAGAQVPASVLKPLRSLWSKMQLRAAYA